MTLEEAKKILKKEFAVIGLHKSTEPFEFNDSNWFKHEKPSVLEAFRVLANGGYYISISGNDYNMREKRLKKEYEKNTKAPNPVKNRIKGNFTGNKSIEYCGDSMPGPGEEQPKEGNPALEEAASQFNDALLDEQAKKIEELTEENEDWKSWHEMQNRQIALSNIAFRNEKNRLGKEISRLNKIIHKKNEELRLTKIREKNLAELGLKYVGENEKLKKKLADKIVDKIDAQTLKSAESALAYKEKVIAEKDEVIADLGKELKAKKALVDHISKIRDSAKINLNLREKECEKLKEALEEKTNLVEMVRKGSKEYCDYGIAAEKMIQKMAEVIVNEEPVSSKDFMQYCRLANGYRFDPQLPDFSKEEEKKLTAKMVDINAKCMRAARESINDVFESYAAKYAKSTLDELKDKAYESFNAKAHNLGPVGSKDGKGIIDQIEEEKKLSLFRDDSVGAVTNQKDCSPVKDTHPTEDNPEEIEIEKAVKLVRKAIKEGHTVSIGYDKAEEGGDQSATIVQCDNGIILSKEEAEIIERCTKNGTELHYSEKDGFTYTNVFGDEIPIICLRGMFHVFTDEEIENMKK